MTEDCIWNTIRVNYQDQSTNHLVWLMPIGGYTSNKAQSSLHDTQLDEKLDLEKMVGPEIQKFRTVRNLEWMWKICARKFLEWWWKNVAATQTLLFQLYLPWSSKSLSVVHRYVIFSFIHSAWCLGNNQPGVGVAWDEFSLTHSILTKDDWGLLWSPMA